MGFLEVFPARAGMSRMVTAGALRAWGVPRASGDEPDLHLTWSPKTACSPRERG